MNFALVIDFDATGKAGAEIDASDSFRMPVEQVLRDQSEHLAAEKGVQHDVMMSASKPVSATVVVAFFVSKNLSVSAHPVPSPCLIIQPAV